MICTDIYTKIYHNPDPNDGFVSNGIYKGTMEFIDLKIKLLRLWNKEQLNKYFSSFEEFISLPRHEVDDYIESVDQMNREDNMERERQTKESIKQTDYLGLDGLV